MKRQQKERKLPLRRCTGCKEMINKSLLIRIVRSGDNDFSLDPTGKLPGRGAYICKNISCLEQARKSKGFERSFKSQLPKEIYDKINHTLILNGGG